VRDRGSRCLNGRGGTINNEDEDLPEMQLKVDECFDDLDIGESKVKRSVSRLKLIHRDAESGRTN
jgi:hypothetical protein